MLDDARSANPVGGAYNQGVVMVGWRGVLDCSQSSSTLYLPGLTRGVAQVHSEDARWHPVPHAHVVGRVDDIRRRSRGTAPEHASSKAVLGGA